MPAACVRSVPWRNPCGFWDGSGELGGGVKEEVIDKVLMEREVMVEGGIGIGCAYSIGSRCWITFAISLHSAKPQSPSTLPV